MADDEKLKEAVAREVHQLGEKEYTFEIPTRDPYESKATLRQKDLLWRMGFKDRTVLDALGKRQAFAMIDQAKSYASRGAEEVKTPTFNDWDIPSSHTQA